MRSKAKRLDNGEWVEGWYDFSSEEHHINYAVSRFPSWIEIKPNTLCQQIKGTDLFEGDFVKTDKLEGFIEWLDYTFYVKVWNGEDYQYHLLSDSWTPTGKNIHD